jgi:hypothetical protein
MRELAARETDAMVRARLVEIAQTFDRYGLKHLGQAQTGGETA